MNIDFNQMLGRYADVAVQVGVNVQTGQELIVNADLNAAPLVREIVRSAYQCGAPLVHVFWGDEQVTLNRFKHAPRDSFDQAPEWPIQSRVGLIDSGAAMLTITADDPDLLREQDPLLISAMQRAASMRGVPLRDRVTNAALNWAIVAAPSQGWAARVFPDAAPDQQQLRLWEAIFATCRIDQADPVATWKRHIADLATRSAHLNGKQYSALAYHGPGTDLTIGLVEGHRWVSGSMSSQRGVEFVANMPTEEVFTMPHRMRVDGTVRSTKPLSLAGTLVEDFGLTFREGRVTDVQAARGEEVLRRHVATDEGAARLGEVALVPERSPIARSKRIFYNTLFDENAACHIALGMALSFNMDGGRTKTPEQFAAAGGNISAIHTDFMIGSAEIDIDGVREDGSREPVMRQGEWAF
ncbi:MAG: aminopeptidase [Roseiflexaceae bacterium]|nr:aminopeptidase [Roseiflexaceae bacterium]